MEILNAGLDVLRAIGRDLLTAPIIIAVVLAAFIIAKKVT